jgi:hypothetical protein
VEKFAWAWENISLSDRVTNPARRHYPVARSMGFWFAGDRIIFTCNPIPGISDHFPVVLTVAID